MNKYLSSMLVGGGSAMQPGDIYANSLAEAAQKAKENWLNGPKLFFGQPAPEPDFIVVTGGPEDAEDFSQFEAGQFNYVNLEKISD